jgi:catechol 2,3-dioxygenase-like lactoylglutathione lyase family enzyme
MPLTSIQHLLVLSDDIEATRDFYRDVLGMREGERPPLEFPGYWLYLGDDPCLHVAERSAYAAHASTLGLEVGASATSGGGAIDHVAFVADDYEEISARLRRGGIEAVENAVPAAGLRQLFVEDPNGVRVEINVSD